MSTPIVNTETHLKETKLNRRNSLLEKNKAAQWTNDVLIKEMDKFAFARSMFLFALMAFFLGNNLNVYLWSFIIITFYMLILRCVRWWTKRWLMYMFEFCYFGITCIIVYLIFYQHEKAFWCTTYVYSTGHMAVAIILFNNQARFSSTDHISSAWLHSMPILTVWAIRWKEVIYSKSLLLKGLHFNLLNADEMLLSSNEERVRLLLLYPLFFWVAWVVLYVIFFYFACNSLIQDDRYKSGLDDFKAMAEKNSCIKCLVGDANENTKIKYLFQHLVTNIVSMPLAWFSYHNFYFNTAYILVLMIFLMWNAGKAQAAILEKHVVKKLDHEAELKVEAEA